MEVHQITDWLGKTNPVISILLYVKPCESRYEAVQQKRVKLSIIELRATFQPLAGAEAVQQKRVKLSRRSAAELQLPAVVATMRPLVTCQIHGKN